MISNNITAKQIAAIIEEDEFDFDASEKRKNEITNCKEITRKTVVFNLLAHAETRGKSITSMVCI